MEDSWLENELELLEICFYLRRRYILDDLFIEKKCDFISIYNEIEDITKLMKTVLRSQVDSLEISKTEKNKIDLLNRKSVLSLTGYSHLCCQNTYKKKRLIIRC